MSALAAPCVRRPIRAAQTERRRAMRYLVPVLALLALGGLSMVSDTGGHPFPPLQDYVRSAQHRARRRPVHASDRVNFMRASSDPLRHLRAGDQPRYGSFSPEDLTNCRPTRRNSEVARRRMGDGRVRRSGVVFVSTLGGDERCRVDFRCSRRLHRFRRWHLRVEAGDRNRRLDPCVPISWRPFSSGSPGPSTGKENGKLGFTREGIGISPAKESVP